MIDPRGCLISCLPASHCVDHNNCHHCCCSFCCCWLLLLEEKEEQPLKQTSNQGYEVLTYKTRRPVTSLETLSLSALRQRQSKDWIKEEGDGNHLCHDIVSLNRATNSFPSPSHLSTDSVQSMYSLKLS